MDGEVVGTGYNHIWLPYLAASRHAEMEALEADAERDERARGSPAG